MNTTKILQDRIRIAFAPAADPSVLVPPSAEELLDLDLAQRLAVIRGTIRGRVVFTTSFGIEDQAIAHAIFRQALTIDVVTLDTGRLFPQTYVCPSTRTFAVRFLQTSPRGDSPCTLLALHLHQVGQRTFTSKLLSMPSTQLSLRRVGLIGQGRGF